MKLKLVVGCTVCVVEKRTCVLSYWIPRIVSPLLSLSSLSLSLSYLSVKKLEEAPPPGQAVPGPRAFINLQNKFGEETKTFIQATQELIGTESTLSYNSSPFCKCFDLDPCLPLYNSEVECFA